MSVQESNNSEEEVEKTKSSSKVDLSRAWLGLTKEYAIVLQGAGSKLAELVRDVQNKDEGGTVTIAYAQLVGAVLDTIKHVGRESTENTKKLDDLVAQFLAGVSYLACKQEIACDISREHLLKLLGREDIEFGYDGLFRDVTACLSILESRLRPREDVETLMSTSLHAKMRKVTFEEYISSGYLNKDIELAVVLQEDHTETEFNVEILDYIRHSASYKSLLNNTVDYVKGIYRYLLQDSFGLDPYVGVLLPVHPYMYIVTDESTLGNDHEAEGVFSIIQEPIYEKFNFELCLDRQFDVKRIVQSTSGKVLFYPKKLLEYAMGRELTYAVSEDFYRRHASSGTWESYSEDYVNPQIEEYVLQGIYYALEKNYLENGELFTSDTFKARYNSPRQEQIQTDMHDKDIGVKVLRCVRKLQESLVMGTLVTKYNNLNSMVNNVVLRMVVLDGVDLPKTRGMSKEIFQGLTNNTLLDYQEGYNISEGRLTPGGAALPYNVLQFGQDYNPLLTNAEPLFGYKAVEKFKKVRKHLSWESILLGVDEKGTPQFAGKGVDDFHLLEHLVHNLMAGSRSGKGVLTMNILACAVADYKPTFYIDGKPDMATMLYHITDGNMFIVNGSKSYMASSDVYGDFRSIADATPDMQEGRAIYGWQAAYDKMPSYLKKVGDFNIKDYYQSNLCGMAYFRSLILMWGILLARVQFGSSNDKDKVEVYEKLGGDKGIITVVDEFRNWQNDFEGAFFGVSNGIFGNPTHLMKTDKSDIARMNRTYKKCLQTFNNMSPGDKKYDETLQELKDAKAAVKDMPWLKIYSTELYKKYGESVAAISAISVAGLKNGEEHRSDWFIIGQDVDKSKLKEGLWHTNISTGAIAAATDDKSVMRGVLDSVSHDWFIGMNTGKPEYAGANEVRSRENYLLNNANYWGYVPDVSSEALREGKPIHGMKYFKPYLVLNDYKEYDKDPEKNVEDFAKRGLRDFQYVTQCRSRVNSNVDGLWNTVRLKHIDPMYANKVTPEDPQWGRLNPGIGFEGLVTLIKSTNEQAPFAPTLDLGGSLEIANFVARAMNYKDYKELIFDLRPEGLFSVEDIKRALQNHIEGKPYVPNLSLFRAYENLEIMQDGPLEQMRREEALAESSLDHEMTAHADEVRGFGSDGLDISEIPSSESEFNESGDLSFEENTRNEDLQVEKGSGIDYFKQADYVLKMLDVKIDSEDKRIACLVAIANILVQVDKGKRGGSDGR